MSRVDEAGAIYGVSLHEVLFAYHYSLEYVFMPCSMLLEACVHIKAQWSLYPLIRVFVASAMHAFPIVHINTRPGGIYSWAKTLIACSVAVSPMPADKAAFFLVGATHRLFCVHLRMEMHGQRILEISAVDTVGCARFSVPEAGKGNIRV